MKKYNTNLMKKELEALHEIETILSVIDINDNPTMHFNHLYKEMKYIFDYESIKLENTKKILKKIIKDYQSILNSVSLNHELTNKRRQIR